jgi:hypothetical protein
MDGLPNCLNIDIGHICEARGECATDDSLNNCQTFDIYVRVECGGSTPTQGELMKNPPDGSEGDNATDAFVEEVDEDDNSTSTTGDNSTDFAPESADNATVTVADNSTTPALESVAPTAAPSTAAPNANLTQDNTTVDASNLTLQTAGPADSIASAAAFTYDRSPGGGASIASDESPAEFTEGEYAAYSTEDASWENLDEPSSASYAASNPYDQDGGWNLNGYFRPDERSSAVLYSRGTVVLLGAIAVFAAVA